MDTGATESGSCFREWKSIIAGCGSVGNLVSREDWRGEKQGVWEFGEGIGLFVSHLIIYIIHLHREEKCRGLGQREANQHIIHKIIRITFRSVP